VDGYCCDSACTGGCQSCAGINTVGGINGTCDLVHEGTDPRDHCAPETTNPCGADGMCGADGQCRPSAPQGKACGADDCVDASAVTKACNGFGACKSTASSCLPYACDAASATCKTSCVTESDCAAGASCDTVSGQCAIVGAICKDAYTVQQPNGQEQSCAPYRCVGGACMDACTTTSDCAPGYACDAPTCIASSGGSGGAAGTGGGGGTGATGGGGDIDGGAGAPGAGASDDAGGCGCRAPGRAGPRGGHALLGALLALGWLRRRKRAAVSPGGPR
jgi:hypothetical protein